MMSKELIKEQYSTVRKFRVNVVHDYTGVGHMNVFDTIEEASMHISQWIGKCYRLDFSKETEIQEDLTFKEAKAIVEALHND